MKMKMKTMTITKMIINCKLKAEGSPVCAINRITLKKEILGNLLENKEFNLRFDNLGYKNKFLFVPINKIVIIQ